MITAKEKNGEQGMKKKITIAVVSVGICLLMLVLFLRKDIEADDIIWTCDVSDENGYVNGGKIYLYRDGRSECIDNISLCNVSAKGENLLVGIQNCYPNAEGFKGIVTYNISSKEVNEVLSSDRIHEFLDDRSLNFRGNIQMTQDGKLYYFVCGDNMMLYDTEKDKMEVLFKASCYQYILNEKETYLYFSENRALFGYNILENTKELLLNDVNNFSVSKDEKMIVYENRKEQALFLYRIDSGENEKLLDLNYLDSQISISNDNRYLLYTDYKESLIPTNRMTEICIFELKTGKRRVIYKGSYSDNITSVTFIE